MSSLAFRLYLECAAAQVFRRSRKLGTIAQVKLGSAKDRCAAAVEIHGARVVLSNLIRPRHHGGTWKVANHFKGDATAKYLQFDFVGTAVTIYCIVPNLPSSSKSITQYAIDFRIDDQLPPPGKTIYNHASDASGDFDYNVPVFNQTGLTNEKHKMMVRMMPVPDTDAVLLFDYATYMCVTLVLFSRYSFDDENSSQSNSPATPSSRPSSTSSSTSKSSSSSRVASDTQTNPSTPSISSSSSTSLSSTSTPQTSNISTDPTSTISSTSAPTPKQNDNPPTTDKQDRLAIILGSSIGSFVVLTILGVFLIYCLRRRPVPVGSDSQASQTWIRPFTTIHPFVRKNGIKGHTTGSAASESNAHLQESTEGEDVSSCYSEDAPPDYSQRGFPL
ncbi:hypothetical protein AAF712_008687 [Marasmius tenuissimus]|uniref:Uncharacterized protein n=1 Tax=Marasmius tenuissimus TaxID=585030 RepID=A0ABR2ZTH5_9AGAR